MSVQLHIPDAPERSAGESYDNKAMACAGFINLNSNSYSETKLTASVLKADQNTQNVKTNTDFN